MAKKLSLIAAAIAVLAFAIPTVASATKLTDPVNTLLAASPTKPVTIVGTSTDLVTTNTAFGNVSCEKVTVTGTLTENTGTKVVVSDDPTGGGSAINCKGAGGTVVTVSNITLTSLTSESTTNSKASFSFELTRSGITCKFTATEIGGTFVSGESKFHVEGTLTTTAACKSGTPAIHGNVSIETTNGTAIVIDD